MRVMDLLLKHSASLEAVTEVEELFLKKLINIKGPVLCKIYVHQYFLVSGLSVILPEMIKVQC